MIHHEIPDELSGAIFDLDDTLLDNKQGGPAGHSLHERSQLQALRLVGEKYDIPELTHVSAEESLDAFLTAPDHTHESAIWNLFIQLGLTSSKAIDFANTILAEAVEAKELLHEKILFDEGDEIPGAIDFARRLADHYDLWGRTSMASTAVRKNANIFIEKKEAHDLFPHQRVFTNETVRFKKPHPEVYDRAFA
ncbi:hypothetical protein EPN95_00715, partial [Patescibacteria group bacterium]